MSREINPPFSSTQASVSILDEHSARGHNGIIMTLSHFVNFTVGNGLLITQYHMQYATVELPVHLRTHKSDEKTVEDRLAVGCPS